MLHPSTSAAPRASTVWFALLLVTYSVPARAQQERLSVSLTVSQTSASGPGGLLDFGTVDANYSHYVAVWLEDDDGTYVRTLGGWGTNFAYDLREWVVASGYDIDAITGATRTNFPDSCSG